MGRVDDGRSAAWRRIPYRRRCKILRSAGIGRRPDAEVALEVGLCRTTVRKYRERLRRPLTASALLLSKRRTRAPWSDDTLASAIRNLADRGHSADAISLRLGIGRSRVARIVRSLGVELDSSQRSRTEAERAAAAEAARDKDRAAFDSWMSRYRDAAYGPLIRRMRSLAAEGMTLAEASRHLGQSESLVLRAARAGGVTFARRGSRENLRRLADRIRPLAESGLHRAAIARRLHVPYSRVGAAARAWGIEVPRGGAGTDWSAEDWLRLDGEIADDLGLTPAYVATRRRELIAKGEPVPPSTRRVRPRQPPIPVEEVDWTRSDARIASQYGVSTSTVARYRGKMRDLGRDVSRGAAREREWWERFNARAAAIAPRVRELQRRGWRIGRIAGRLGVTPGLAGAAARLAAGGSSMAGPPDWTGVDWRRTDAEIAEALGVSESTVHVRRWRLRRQGREVPPAPRRTWKGVPPVSWEGVDWTMSNDAIAAERGVSPVYVSAARGRLRKAGEQIPMAPIPTGRLRERMMARAEAAVERVRPLLREGLRVGEIARRLGLSFGVAGIAVRLAKKGTPPPAEPGCPTPSTDGRTQTR